MGRVLVRWDHRNNGRLHTSSLLLHPKSALRLNASDNKSDLQRQLLTKSTLILRTVSFTLIPSVSPVTSTLWSGCSTRKAEQVYLCTWMSFTFLNVMTTAFLSLLLAELLLFLRQPFIGHNFKLLDHPIFCPPHGPQYVPPCGAPDWIQLLTVVWPQHSKTDMTHFLVPDDTWLFV